MPKCKSRYTHFMFKGQFLLKHQVLKIFEEVVKSIHTLNFITYSVCY